MYHQVSTQNINKCDDGTRCQVDISQQDDECHTDGSNTKYGYLAEHHKQVVWIYKSWVCNRKCNNKNYKYDPDRLIF